MDIKKKQTAGQRMIVSAKEALAFAQGEDNGCVVHELEPPNLPHMTGNAPRGKPESPSPFISPLSGR